jgi:hypothetical protein
MATKRKPMKLDLKEGALHEQMGVKKGEKLPKSAVNKLASAKPGTKVKVGDKTVTASEKTKKRANFAKVAATWKKGSKKK